MVIQRTIENLRERSKDERRAVAFGVALTVMLILFLAWAILFFKSLKTTTDVSQIHAVYTDTMQHAQETFQSDAPQKIVPASQTQDTNYAATPEGELLIIDDSKASTTVR